MPFCHSRGSACHSGQVSRSPGICSLRIETRQSLVYLLVDVVTPFLALAQTTYPLPLHNLHSHPPSVSASQPFRRRSLVSLPPTLKSDDHNKSFAEPKTLRVRGRRDGNISPTRIRLFTSVAFTFSPVHSPSRASLGWSSHSTPSP